VQARAEGPRGMKTIQETMERAIDLHRTGRLPEAEELYRRVLKINPDHPDALHLLGVLNHQAGRNERALELVRRAITGSPGTAVYHNNMGLVLCALGRILEALQAYEEALRLNPGYAEACNNLGNALRDLGRIEAAEERFREALRLNPDLAGAHCNLGNALREQGRTGEAVDAFRKAILLEPDSADAHYNLGNTLKDLGRLDHAVASFKEAIGLRPDFAGAHNNLGTTLQDQGRTDQAMEHFREALRLDPHYPEAYNNLGTALKEKGEIDEAMEAFEAALGLRPDYSSAHFNRGLALLLKGRFREGWKGYEWRRKERTWRVTYPYRFKAPRWGGESFRGRRLFVHDEQGFGDTLQFLRYLPMVKARGGTLILEAKKPLMGLLRGFPGIDELVEQSQDGRPAVEFDLYISLMSLPGIFRTTLESIPGNVPYLRGDPAKATFWKRRMGGEGFRVGLVWEGRTGTYEQRRRSLNPLGFAPLGPMAGVRLYGLQKQEHPDRGGRIPDEMNVVNLGEHLEDFADTAGVIENLDLVISIDTAVAHLAGAMGRRTWVLLPYVPDWRWLLDRDDSPWYPTMRLFRQQKKGDWDGVLRRVVESMHGLVTRGG
jgi:tetratricopeptide (TPR) repeat protein